MEKYIVLRSAKDREEVDRIPVTPENMKNIHEFILKHYESTKEWIEIVHRIEILENGHYKIIGEDEGEPFEEEYMITIEETFDLNTLNEDQKKQLANVSHILWGAKDEEEYYERKAKEWENRYNAYVKPLFDIVEGRNSTKANDIVSAIRSLKYNGEAVTPEKVLEKLLENPYKQNWMAVIEKGDLRMFAWAVFYYKDWEALDHETKDKIKKARSKKYARA